MARLSRLFALVLVLAVVAGTAQAAPISIRTSAGTSQTGWPAGLFEGLLQWVDARLASLPGLVAAWGEAGCEMDPDGRCIDHPAAAPVPPDSSSTLGNPAVDAGCEMDPNGSC